jgi:hypothetical protein
MSLSLERSHSPPAATCGIFDPSATGSALEWALLDDAFRAKPGPASSVITDPCECWLLGQWLAPEPILQVIAFWARHSATFAIRGTSANLNEVL